MVTGFSQEAVLKRFDALGSNEKEVVHDIYSAYRSARAASVQAALNVEFEESVGLVNDANRVFLNNVRLLWKVVKLLER